MTEEPPLGAHLTTPRRGYVHHGIYVGQGRVVHYAGWSRLLRRGPVEEVPIERFARGRPLQVKAWPMPRFSGAQVAERARSRLGEDRYRVWTNNCEHFAHWSVTGQSRSSQVEQWIGALRGLRGALAAGWPLGRLGRLGRRRAA